VAARGVNGRDRDGNEFIGFLHEQFQFRGLHESGLGQELQYGFMCSVFLGAALGAVALPTFSSFNPQSAIHNPQSAFRNPQWHESAIPPGPRLKICLI